MDSFSNLILKGTSLTPKKDLTITGFTRNFTRNSGRVCWRCGIGEWAGSVSRRCGRQTGWRLSVLLLEEDLEFFQSQHTGPAMLHLFYRSCPSRPPIPPKSESSAIFGNVSTGCCSPIRSILLKLKVETRS